jgi:AraC-like DNA-binding protein
MVSWAGVVRIGGAHALPQVLRDLGADPRKLCAAAGMGLEFFDDPENVVPYPTVARLLHLAVEQTGCKHVGLLFGQQNTLRSLGLVGYLARNSPDVESGLRTLVAMLHHHDRGGAPTMTVENGMVSVGFAIYRSNLPGMSQIADAAAATICNILRELCGSAAFKPAEVRLMHAVPGDTRPLQRFFRAPLRFNAEENAIVIPAALLKQSVPGADPALLQILQRQVVVLESRNHRSLAEQLRGTLRTTLLLGKSSSDEIALLHGMHRRTLNRRLREEGVAFGQLREEVRFEIARQMLAESRAPLTQVATMLNYADASAFSRAFSRWAGMTPTAWREGGGAGKRGGPAPKSSKARGKRA